MAYQQSPRTQEHLISNIYNVLDRSSASIARSIQISNENEQIGTEVLSELGEQRESLLRTSDRLQNAQEDLTRSGRILRKMRNEILYNRIILILIIILEVGILVGLLVIKFLRK